MHQLVRGVLLFFTVLRVYWLWLCATKTYELLSANIVGPAILWGFATFGCLMLLWAIKRGWEPE